MLPMVELTIFALGILLIDLLIPREWKWLNAVAAFVGVLFSTVCVWQIQNTMPPRSFGFSGALLVDHFALYFWYLFLASAAVAILMSARYLDVEDEHHGEYYALLLFSVVGMMCMASGIDIVLLFIGLELMAISIYVLVGFLRRDRRSNEAALKYLLLGAFSSGIFAYGLSLFYGLTGSTNLAAIARAVSGMDPKNPVLVIALLTTIVGLLFKIAAVPFHQWAPDAYEGAPTCITGFMSVAVKGCLGLAAPHSDFRLDCVARGVHADHRCCRGCHVDGRQSGGDDAVEYQAPARVLFDCARRLYVAGAGRDGDVAVQ
jgi:NADH-quinone oxidoreductase subunit N